MRTRIAASSLAALIVIVFVEFSPGGCGREHPGGTRPPGPEQVRVEPPRRPTGAPLAYGESAMVKIRPELPAPPDSLEGRGVRVIGARNEFLSFQIVIHGGVRGAHDVNVSYETELQGPGTISYESVSLYREEFIRISRPTFAGEDGGVELQGRWPDPLIPDVDESALEKRNAFPFDIPPGEARVIWVDIHVPSDAPPGVYNGSFRVITTSDGLGPTPITLRHRIPVALTVVDVEMPSTPSLPTAFLLYVPNLCKAHGVDCRVLEEPTRSLLQGYLRMGLDHRISLSSAFYVYDTPEDWAAFDAAYGPFLDGTAATRLRGARLTSVQYQGPRTERSYAEFARHYKERGWFERAYDYSADEPPRTISFDEARANARFAKRASILRQDPSDPPIRTLMTTVHWLAKQNGYLDEIDVMSPLVSWIDTPAHPYEGVRADYESFARQPGREVWLYQSCASHGCWHREPRPENVPDAGWPSIMVDASAAKNRANEWLVFRMGMHGEFYYETVLALESAWEDLYQYGGNGDGTLFYPGTPDRIGGVTPVPVASMRLKYIRMGIQDYEWLRWVREAGDEACAREAADRLVPASWLVPDNGQAFETARDQLIGCYFQAKLPK